MENLNIASPVSPQIMQFLNCLTCPVCLDKLEPPITLCENGHNICCRCRRRVDRCPVCRGGHSPVRNLLAETAFELFVDKVRCKYYSSGCDSDLMTRSALVQHETICEYRSVICNLKTSKVDCDCNDNKVPFENFLLHMEKAHRMKGVTKVYGTAHVKFPCDSKPQDLARLPSWDPWILKCYGRTFIAMRAYIQNKVYFWIVGNVTVEEAKEYSASIFITDKSKTNKRLWDGSVLSAHKGGLTNDPSEFCSFEACYIPFTVYSKYWDINPETEMFEVKHVFKVNKKGK